MKLQQVTLLLETYKVDISSFYEKESDGSLYFNLSKGIKNQQKELPIMFELLEGKYASKWIAEWLYDEKNAKTQQENLDFIVNKWCVPLQEQYDEIVKQLKTLGGKYKVELRAESIEKIAKEVKENSQSEYFGEHGWKGLLNRLYVTIIAGNVQMGLMFEYSSKKFEEFELSPFDEYSDSDAEDYEKVINVINKLTLKKGKKKRFYSSQPQDRIAVIRKSGRLFDNMYVADKRSVADNYWVQEQDRSIISFVMDDLNVVDLGSGEYAVIGNPEIDNIQIFEH